jgi:hypothetical protein
MTDKQRFMKLRKRVINAVFKAIEEDCAHKSYEGTFEVTVSYPNAFEESDEPDYFQIALHCYVLGTSRHYEWSGNTFKEAIGKCEREVIPWCERYGC